ncbi:MAG TPA: hypothetical protein VEL28_23445, partial [Candidatus Binatia bacterium]|nr:hypothetical protein [Candidatus Binatia bacterium]
MSPSAATRAPIGRAGALAIGIVLLLAYALPLYAPPQPVLTVLVTPWTPWMHRLFPGVPSWWILVRLGCLLAGAALMAWSMPRSGSDEWSEEPAAGAEESSLVRFTFGLGAVLAMLSPFAGSLPRSGQLAYLAALLLGPWLLSMFDRTVDAASVARRAALPAVVALVWMAVRLPAAFGSERIADGVDYLSVYRCFEIAASEQTSLMTEGCWTGYTLAPLIFQGNGVLGWNGIPLSMPIIQTVSAVSTATVAVIVGTLASAAFGVVAGPVAAAAFLWSPIVLLRLLIVGAPSHTLVGAVLLALALILRRRPRTAHAAAFGAFSGHGLLLPNTILIAPLLFLVALPGLLRRRSALLACLLFLAAGFVPGASTLGDMLTTARSQATASVAWAPLDGYFGGRIAPSLAEGAGHAGRTAALDVAAGLILSPVAVARASTRHWGDVIIEPLAAALFVVGAAAALLAWRRRMAR